MKADGEKRFVFYVGPKIFWVLVGKRNRSDFYFKINFSFFIRFIDVKD